MPFPDWLYITALIVPALGVAGVTPWVRALCLNKNWVDEPGERKTQKQPVPLAGGIALGIGWCLTLILALIWIRWGASGEGGMLQTAARARGFELAGIGGGALLLFIVGWWDDLHDLRAHWKLLGQILAASLVAFSGVRITLFLENPAWSYLLTILWIVLLVNAFNFLDNMNGLCAGVGAIAAFYLGWNGASQGHFLVTAACWTLAGGLVGYLPYNFPRSTVYLGDSGSHLVGFGVGVLAILPHFYSSANPSRADVLDPLLILSVPLVDLLWVVSWRTWHGQPFWVGDRNHLSHQLVRLGLSPTRAVCLLWLVGAVAGAWALLT